MCCLDFTHLVRFTPRTPRAGKGRPGRLLHSTQPPRTHAHMPAPFLQLRGRPLSLPCKQATSSLGPAEERPLVPGPDGRGSRSRRPNTAALSHPVARGGPGLWCVEIHEPCGVLRRASLKRRSPLLLHPNYSSQLCLLCPHTVQDYSPASGDSSFPSCPLVLPLQGALKHLALPLLLGDSMPPPAATPSRHHHHSRF